MRKFHAVTRSGAGHLKGQQKEFRSLEISQDAAVNKEYCINRRAEEITCMVEQVGNHGVISTLLQILWREGEMFIESLSPQVEGESQRLEGGERRISRRSGYETWDLQPNQSSEREGILLQITEMSPIHVVKTSYNSLIHNFHRNSPKKIFEFSYRCTSIIEPL